MNAFSASIAASALQLVDYRYNIRGWLTGINKSDLTDDNGAATNDIWGMTIFYDQADASGGIVNAPRFNGQVSAVKWKANDQFSGSANPVRERGYAYAYDAVNRLLSAHYTANGGTSWNAEVSGYDEAVGAYDQNGNIQSLTRNSLASGATTAVTIDNLAYTYKSGGASNQLDAVKDNATGATATMGFNDGANAAGEYQYDTNGSLISDANKSQVITYNDLNKVSKIAVTGGGWIEYMYDASGARIRKTVYSGSGAAINQLDYMDGFTYQSGALSYFNMPEGKVDVSGTNFTYEYFIKDNLGNTRVSFVDNGSGTAKVMQENEYYAFGMTMQGMVVRTAQPTNANKQLYNGGSELQDDLGYENSYSTFYRDYDQVLGRFNAMDPAVDKYADWTPYNFAFNDPANKNDPGGDDPNIRFIAPAPREAAQGGWSPAPMLPTPSPGQQAAQMEQAAQTAVGGFYQFLQDSRTWERGADVQMAAAAAANANAGTQQDMQAEVSNAMTTPGNATLTPNGYGGWNNSQHGIMLSEVNIRDISPGGKFPSWWGNGTLFVNDNANQGGPSVSISSSVWEISRIAANFSVSGIKASGLQIIQVYSGSGGMSGKLGFVDGGINSPYAKQNGPAQPNAPYYLTPGEVASGVTWNGTSGTVLFQDQQNGGYYNDVSGFNVIVVAQNYNGTGVDRLLGGFTWGYNNMAPINGGQINYSPTVSPAAIQIIQQDYPGYKFTK